MLTNLFVIIHVSTCASSNNFLFNGCNSLKLWKKVFKRVKYKLFYKQSQITKLFIHFENVFGP